MALYAKILSIIAERNASYRANQDIVMKQSKEDWN